MIPGGVSTHVDIAGHNAVAGHANLIFCIFFIFFGPFCSAVYILQIQIMDMASVIPGSDHDQI